jgi:hypothetical protein
MVFLHAQNISDDHPAVEFLHELESTAYFVDKNLSGYILARCIIQAILGWANMLNCLNVGALYVLLFFLTQLSRVWLSLFPTLV